MSLSRWMDDVDRYLRAVCGLTHRDIADQSWADWYGDGMTPEEAAREALAAEDFPFGDE